jgi:hypothetical protein
VTPGTPPSPSTHQPPQPAASTGRPAAGRWHSAPWWAGVGGLATVLATVIALVAWWFPRSNGAEPARSATSNASATTVPVAAVAEVPVVTDCRKGLVLPAPGSSAVPRPRDGSMPPGAVLGDGAAIGITVQGTNSAAVVLTALRVEIVKTGGPLSGAFLPFGCASAVEPRHFAVDLTGRPPVVRAVAGSDAGTAVPARDFPFKVSDSDPEQFVVQVGSPTEDIQFVLFLRWTSAGHQGELRIDDNGEPFQVSATTAAQRFCLDQINSRWLPPVQGQTC